MTIDNISLISHADWSKNPHKRWMAVAVLQANRRWLVCELFNVTQLSSLLSHLKSRLLQPGCILSGFDFPIGLPAGYAEKAGITDYLSALPLFGKVEWDQFYFPAEHPSEISIHRPFYPYRPGGTKRSDLVRKLDLPFGNLRRLCEIGHENRRPACPLFWTLGGQQVGKAAISGWQDLLVHALEDHHLKLKIWPFSGSFADLCQPDNIIVVETYPAEFYGHLELSFSSPVRKSKTCQSDRQTFSERLISWSEAHNLDLDDSIVSSVRDGFGDDLDGEDRFDALVGLYGMINVVIGHHALWEPNMPQISKIEGWIFGQGKPKGVSIVNWIIS